MLVKNPLANNLIQKATREGYGDGLAAAGEIYEKLVVLDADLAGSTKTSIFAKKRPDHFFNFGVAEQSLVGHAAGFALSGMIPVVSSFAMFLTGRAWEIIRNSIAYPNLNVKLAASHAGITLGEDGASHQIIEDIGIMRAIPNMKVLVPADYWQAYHAIQQALTVNGPVYIRLGRSKLPILYSQKYIPKIGKAKVIQKGEKLAFFSAGVMVHEAWCLAKIFEEKYRIKPWVIDLFSIKPLDEELILEITSQVESIYTFEEHNVLTGIGSAITELLSEKHPIRIKRSGIQDKFGQSGTADDLMKYYGLRAPELFSSLFSNWR